MIDYKQIINELNKYGITNKLEQAIFLGQAYYESTGFTNLVESSKYQFVRAKFIFPKYKDIISAEQNKLMAADTFICPQPWLFDLVYGNRMGNQDNGNNDDDGYNYRGHGIFQLTGKDNYLDFLNFLTRQKINTQYNINNIGDYVQTMDGAILSAIYFWLKNNIGILARKGDIDGVTRKINGGTLGIIERTALINKYKKLLGIV